MSQLSQVKRMIAADKASGLEATTFVVSVLVPVVADHNRRVKFKFPFWGFSVPAGSRYGTEWIDEVAYGEGSEKILKSIQTPGGLAYFSELKKTVIAEERKFEKMASSLRHSLASYSDSELVARYGRFVKEYSFYYGLGVITFLYESILSEKLMRSLALRYTDAAGRLPHLLRSPYRSFMLRSEQALAKIKSTRRPSERLALIKRYQEEFFYIRANYGQAPLVTDNFILDRVKHLEVHVAKAAAPIKTKLESWERQLIKLLKISEIIRDKRKQLNIIGSYMMFRFLEEAARRRYLPANLISRAFWFEYGDLFSNTVKFVQGLRKRKEFSIAYDHGRYLYFNRVALRERKFSARGVMEISGTPAATGLIRGSVRKVMTGKDFSSFKKGEILVTAMTRPEFLPIMKRAAAIITDEGGLTCHAAIVARELGIPCIVGVKGATRILRNGGRVEVDANRGIVKIV